VLAAVRALGYLLALVAGAAAGLLGSFTFAYTYDGLPVGLAVAMALSLTVFVAAGLALRSRAAAASAAAGWLVLVLILSRYGPGRDLVVPATTLGMIWLLVGAVVAGLSLAVPYAAPALDRNRSRKPTQAPSVESSGTAPTRR
jgi:Family of unknown function (DUF6113)